jgi:hypothetical protein
MFISNFVEIHQVVQNMGQHMDSNVITKTYFPPQGKERTPKEINQYR